MTRRIFVATSLATASLNAQQAQPPLLTLDDFNTHLDIWMFEVKLNRHKTVGAILEINPHTWRLIKQNAHRFVAETRAALAKDITLLLAIKENEPIAAIARRKGMKIYRNSFGKEEWPEWLKLLDEMANDSGQPAPK